MTSFLFITAILLAAASAVTCCPASDRDALLAFKASLHEPYLGIFNSWTGNDCCHKWYGISCDSTNGRVADINLRGESEDPLFQKAHRTGYMSGTISPAICKLTWLSSIIIADWKGITGPIPDCVSYLPYLRMLDLIGYIPRSISGLTSLMHLDLRNNQFSGPLPRDIGKLRMMSRALLSRNRISGPIPNTISYIYRLSDLDLSLNQISGAIPPSLGKMGVLATLNLDGNKLSGTIPTTLINSGVSILNLSKNALEGNIPDVFGPRSYFTAMDLSYNQLKGPIPKSISAASYIGHLDLSHNHLCGQIPVGSPFDHLEASSFANNDCLCGKPLRSC
ncbi:DNA damage-repair/toleration protein DRT100 [Heracleum sosnowskyi]|uniref:DNA damage-repair/toleration protein DRT100 n=1 Tax=Heracleum sosnowskyi TaxID=360622 RepID=A0AAD8GWR0_9APIA|nr:DNA damage-repair/toleration protein DRT100 [Heracleum sosnowskyi]